MANFFPPTFEETRFVCKDCGHMFQGRDCEKGLLGMPTGPFALLLSRFGLQGPKCPGCGSRNTEKDMFVCY